MDITTAVRSDALPAVGSLLLPGALVAAPWVALAWGEPHNLRVFADSKEGLATAAAALLVIGAGLIVESLGTFVESHIVDKLHKDPKKLQERWIDYLKIAWVTEPIGNHYLRRVLTTFKFELNSLVAVVATTPGTLLLGHYHVIPAHAVYWLMVLIAVLFIYLSYAVYVDSEVLDRLRGDLIKVANEQKALAEAMAKQPKS